MKLKGGILLIIAHINDKNTLIIYVIEESSFPSNCFSPDESVDIIAIAIIIIKANISFICECYK